MIKCAIIYTGDIRSFSKEENQKNHLDNFLNPLKENASVDCFVHTYFHSNADSMIKSLDPTVCVLENRDKLDDVPQDWKLCEKLVHGSPTSIVSRLYYQLRKIYLTSKLINDTYDFIARVRFDIIFGKKINFDLDYMKNKIYIPYNMDGQPDPRYEGIVDVFSFGDYVNMMHYCNFFNYAIKYANKRNDFYTEILLRDHLEGIDITREECFWRIDNSMGGSENQ